MWLAGTKIAPKSQVRTIDFRILQIKHLQWHTPNQNKLPVAAHYFLVAMGHPSSGCRIPLTFFNISQLVRELAGPILPQSVAEFAGQRQVGLNTERQVFISSEKRDTISDEI
jgi:hypothetical protein